MVKDMSDPSTHMPGGGRPDAKTFIWDLVLWAWGNGTEDTSSAHDLVTAVSGSGGHQAEEGLQVVTVPEKLAGCHPQSMERGGRGQMQDSHVSEMLPFSPLPSWHCFLGTTCTG